jgi:ubiquinone/menaquinone biosynthesis C-methylase UbiE
MSDSSFLDTGPAAELYEQHLVPLTFAEHSRAMASRFEDMVAGRLLEIAAGTGALTRELRKLLPGAVEIVATDLNQPMLDQAKAVPEAGLITWQQADVMALPFEDDSFDAAVCQFGAMFFLTRSRPSLRSTACCGPADASASVCGTGWKRTY